MAGRAVKALIREIQRDSVRPAEILHLDLYEVRADEKVTLSVPVHLIGIPDGVRNFGGVLDHSLRELEIEVLPADIPGARRARRHRADHRPLALRARHQDREGRDPQRPRHAGLHRGGAAGRRGAGRGRRKSRADRAGAHPQAEARGRTRAKPNRRPEPCTRSWGWAIPARSTTKPGTTPGFASPIIWRLAGSWASFRRGERAREAEGTWQGAPVRVLKPQTYMNRSGAAIAPLRALRTSIPASTS